MLSGPVRENRSQAPCPTSSASASDPGIRQEPLLLDGGGVDAGQAGVLLQRGPQGIGGGVLPQGQVAQPVDEPAAVGGQPLGAPGVVDEVDRRVDPEQDRVLQTPAEPEVEA